MSGSPPPGRTTDFTASAALSSSSSALGFDGSRRNSPAFSRLARCACTVDDEASPLTKLGVALFRFQLNLAQPAHKYLFPEIIDLDLHLLKVGIPVVFGARGAEVRLPKILDALPAAQDRRQPAMPAAE